MPPKQIKKSIAKKSKTKKKYNPFPDPKKGKGRSVLKRPAKAKSTTWKEVPYVRPNDAVEERRMDRVLWKRKLADLLQASDAQLFKLLRQDGLPQDWTGKRCPRCDKGTLSKLQPNVGHGMPRHRCNLVSHTSILTTCTQSL